MSGSKSHTKNAAFGLVTGLILLLLYLAQFLSIVEIISSEKILRIISVVGALCFMWGGYWFVKFKGYNGFLGVPLGWLGVVGVFFMLILPNRSEQPSRIHRLIWTSWGISVLAILLFILAPVFCKSACDSKVAMQESIINGDLEAVQYCFGDRESLNVRFEMDSTPLHVASASGHADIVNYFLSIGASVQAEAEHSTTPLQMAAASGNLAVVKMLIGNGAEVETKNDLGRTALHMASYSGHADVVSYLLVNGASIDLADTDGHTALLGAAMKGHLNLVKILLKNGSKVDGKDKRSITPLLWAISGRFGDIAALLVEKGAKVNVADDRGFFPLFGAAFYGDVELALLLIKKGARVDARNASGQSALHAAVVGKQIEAVRLLLRNRARVDLVDNDGFSPLDIALKMDIQEIVDILKSGGGSFSTSASYRVEKIPTQKTGRREKALELLYESRQILVGKSGLEMNMKNYRSALKKCDDAIQTDPALAIAHIVRAQFANQEENWQKMVKHFEKGLVLIDQKDQPLNPLGQLPGAEATIEEVKGDVHCMLAYAYLQQAQNARKEQRFEKEQQLLAKMHKNLKMGLRMKPTPPVRHMAEQMLQAFQQAP